MSSPGPTPVFVVARNPQDDTKLPLLLRLPLEGGLILKARERWPTTTRVYCHVFEDEWSEDIEVVEETPALLCRRRGAAIDLLLDRPRLARSQFVFTQGQRARGDLLADAEDRSRRQLRRQDPPEGCQNSDSASNLGG